jgi:hypothetical protein
MAINSPLLDTGRTVRRPVVREVRLNPLVWETPLSASLAIEPERACEAPRLFWRAFDDTSGSTWGGVVPHSCARAPAAAHVCTGRAWAQRWHGAGVLWPAAARRRTLVHMAGPSTKPKSSGEPVFVPHPDDVEAVSEGLDQAERGELLSAEESAAYLRSLLGDELPAK